MLAMNINYRIKFMICVIVPAVLIVIIGGTTICHHINEKVVCVSFGVPLYIYISLARFFHAGEPFNIFLLFIVSAGYLAIFLAPLYYIFRSFKWSLFFVQIGLGIIHFLIGAAFLNC